MRFRFLIAAILILVINQARADQELYRIRVVNSEFGPVEVSADGGKTYLKVGKVTIPATMVTGGYAASVYALPGTVAATAVHGIRIKTAGDKECSREAAQVISIVPAEFAATPKGFGGYATGSSAICTDIAAGHSIFRNLSPLVGNKVFEEEWDRLVPLPDIYIPRERDVLVIIVTMPERYPEVIAFENRQGGMVKAVYSNGTESIAKVERPVRGVGRFDATGYTGVGRINTNHTGVLTISTAPIAHGGKDGSSVETRGGFMVQPSRHARLALEVAQVMVVGPISGGWLEGTPPLFSGYLGLFYDPTDESKSFLVDCKRKDTDWMPLPETVGVHNDALASLTDIRIRFPKLTSEWAKSQLAQCHSEYLEACRAKALKTGSVVTGVLTIEIPGGGLQGVKLVNLYVDGQFRGAINTSPYVFKVDTSAMPKGEHSAELRAVNASGGTVRQITKVFFVQ